MTYYYYYYENFFANTYICYFCKSRENIHNHINLCNIIYQLHGPVKINDFYPKINNTLAIQSICLCCADVFKTKPDEFLFKYDLGLL